MRVVVTVSFLVVVASVGAGEAASPCCAEYPCPANRPVADPGSGPEGARCCADASGSDCVPAPNAGWRCSDDPAASIAGAVENAAAGACGEVDAEICFGGGFYSDGSTPHGCLGLPGGNFFYGNAPQTDPVGCTIAAVEGCCAADACVSD